MWMNMEENRKCHTTSGGRLGSRLYSLWDIYKKSIIALYKSHFNMDKYSYKWELTEFLQ
jgi:hypothetical protein